MVYSTQKGERKTISLVDGSTINLNSESVLKISENYNKTKRELELKGEAFFEVAENPEKPFIVHSNNFTTTDLGTSFNIRDSEEGCIEVTVRTGKVEVNNAELHKKILLIKGERAVFTNKNNNFVKSKSSSPNYYEWKDNILRFDNINVNKAFQKIEKWYGIRIECKSKNILNNNIQAVYTNENIKNLMDDLQFILGFNYKYKNDSTIIIN